MSLVKNTSGQFLYATLINKVTGDPITSGATLDLAKDGSVAAAAEAVLTYKTKGMWEAALSQMDTNANDIGYVWGGTNVVPQGGTIITDEHSRSAIVELQASLNLLLGRVSETLFEGMTSLAQWLGAMAGKQTPDEIALEEIRATGVGGGTYTSATDSLEAIRERGDEAWAGGATPSPTPDSPCAQNPAQTRGPTTQPVLTPTPLLRTLVRNGNIN